LDGNQPAPAKESTVMPNSKEYRLLIIEDNPDDAELMSLELERAGITPDITRVETRADFAEALRAGGWDAILSDFKLGDFNAIEALNIYKQSGLDIPFIVVSGTIGEETAAKMMKEGAHDFFIKERLTRLGAAIEREIREATVRAEHRRAVAELMESEKRFRVLADAAPVMIWGASGGMRRDYFNRPWLDFRGGTQDGESGDGWMNGIHLDDVERVRKTLADAYLAGKEYKVEYRLRRHDGEYRWIMERGIPRPPHGAPDFGFLGSCVDITEHKQTEEELKRSLKTRDEFLSAASHELRTPVTALSLNLDVMERKTKAFNAAGEALGGYVETAKRQLQRLTRLVDHMLDVARFTAGKMRFAPEEIDLGKKVQDIIANLRETIAGSGSSVTFHATEPVVGFWDPMQIDSVILNLLTNAIKYGAGKPIEVTVEKRGNVGRLVVRDQGIGIPPESREIIFQRFERGVSDENYAGLGIGLWIVRNFVEAHGGTVKVESVLGAGSSFEVELPLIPQTAP
jgi:PAS domain S-box-containing protein